MSDPARPLTPKQQRFVEEYLLDLNATQAAIRAGYSARSADVQGARLLGDARVSTAVAAGRDAQKAALAEKAEAAELTRQWVIDRLRENVQRCMQAEPVRDREGNPTGEYTYQAVPANRALELLGKEIGMFKDRSVNLLVDLDRATPEEVERIANGEDPEKVLGR